MTNTFAEEGVFGDCKPMDLINIDWTNLDHRRIVIASLVKAVYQRERDRQAKKKDAKCEPEAPFWWESYHFRHVEDIKDHDDFHFHSIFGSIFEYKPPNHHNIPSQHRQPKYVIAFRGTLLKSRRFFKDLWLDAALFLNKRTRYKSSLQPVHDIIQKVGSENVWLAGHSLGAAIALQLGKTMAKNGQYIETYLFNPPYISSPIEMLSSRKLKTGLRMVRSVMTAGAVALKSVVKKNQTSPTQAQDVFNMLRPWIPYLFVNGKDPICCEYIGYFEHREKMESWSCDILQRYIVKNSLISLGSSVFGGHAEALHQIPSCFLVKNCCKAKGCHSISQWWEPNLNLQAKLYKYTLRNKVHNIQD